MRFKIDENLPDELAVLLRENRWEATTVVDQNIGGAVDPRVAEVCDVEDRILVTFDVGFANIRAYPPASHPGFIVFRLARQDKPHVLRVSPKVIEKLRDRGLRNELWVVDESRIRIRW
jgi:predicted nuclease of predicted toxin-antitoxin system